MPRVTTPLPDTRAARTPLQEAISLWPHFLLSQRMHRRRWAQGLGVAVAIAGLLTVLARRKRSPW